MAGLHSENNNSDRICVDSVSFDDSVESTTAGHRLFASILRDSTNLEQTDYPERTFVKCSVCLKD